MSVGVTIPSTHAVFVDHHRHMDRVLAEHLEDFQDRRPLMHDERLAQRGGEIEAAGAGKLVEEILGVDDAGELVEALAAGRKARMPAVGDLLADRLGRIVEVDPHDLHARRHHASHRAVGEVQHAVDHVALRRVEDAGARPFRDHAPHLLLGHRAFRLVRDAQQPDQRLGGDAQQPDDRRAGDRKPRHERRDPGGDRAPDC